MDSNLFQENQIVTIRIPQFEVFMTTLPEDIVKKLNKASEEIQDSWNAPKFNHNLIGHIKKQYALENTDDYLDNFILSLANIYFNHLNSNGYIHYSFSKPVNLEFGKPWINFQGPREFNPIHNHSGVLSWVIWLKIPFDPKKEQEHFPDFKSGKVRNGSLQFVYPSALKGLEMHVMDLDKSYEGRIIIFPSTLHHQVYPYFTTEDYRISIAGNIFFGEMNNNERN
jgi:hypothetical protein